MCNPHPALACPAPDRPLVPPLRARARARTHTHTHTHTHTNTHTHTHTCTHSLERLSSARRAWGGGGREATDADDYCFRSNMGMGEGKGEQEGGEGKWTSALDLTLPG